MLTIASVDPDQIEFDHEAETGDAWLRLVSIDTDGQEHPLTFEVTALRQLWRALSAFQRRFPTVLASQ